MTNANQAYPHRHKVNTSPWLEGTLELVHDHAVPTYDQHIIVLGVDGNQDEELKTQALLRAAGWNIRHPVESPDKSS